MDFLIQAEQVLHSEVGFGTMLARLCVAAVLGLVIGLDREYRQHPAGMRTHMLVSLAAATFAVLTFELIARSEGDGTAQAGPGDAGGKLAEALVREGHVGEARLPEQAIAMVKKLVEVHGGVLLCWRVAVLAGPEPARRTLAHGPCRGAVLSNHWRCP